MKRTAVFIVIGLFLVLLLVPIVSAWYSSSSFTQMSSSSGCSWNPWSGRVCGQSSSFTQATSTSYGGFAPWGGGWGGNYYSSYSSWQRSTSWGFWANESQMEDVTGVWDTDLLGEIKLKLTGDDIIRGSYMNGEDHGYIQGNFTYENLTHPMMDGIWWEEPTYQPPYSAGVMEITFLDNSTLEGIFAYSDGTWGTFNGTKTSGDLSEETEEMLIDMPEVNWEINDEEEKDYIVFNSPETNPVMNEGSETTL